MKLLFNQERKPVLIFLALLAALSSLFYTLIISNGKLGAGRGLYVTGLMWCPGIAALITCQITGRGFAGLGWQWGKWKYQLWSYLIPALYGFIAYLIIWTIGWGGFYNKDHVTNVAKSFGWERLPDGWVILFYTLFMGLFGMARSTAAALGEEIGWRGFLAPELFKRVGYTKTSLLTGIIWAIWHYPILLFADYNSGTAAWYGLTCFTVMVISISFVFTWFRVRSGSLWTGALLHASHNLFIQAIYTPLTSDTGNTKYYIDEFGAVLPVVCVCFAVYFWRKRGLLVLPGQDT